MIEVQMEFEEIMEISEGREILTCRKCGSGDYRTEESTVNLKAVCNNCDSYIKFLPKPIGKVNWETETIPLRKHKGKTFKQVAVEDPKYIRWIAKEVKGRLSAIANLAIEEFMI